MELSPVASAKHVQMAIDLFAVSTAETARHTVVFEGLSPTEQKLIKVNLLLFFLFDSNHRMILICLYRHNITTDGLKIDRYR